MRIKLTILVSLLTLSCFASGDNVITVRYDGAKAEVSKVQPSDSVKVNVNGSKVSIENLSSGSELAIRISGTSDDGTFVLKSNAKARIELNNLKLQSCEGAPLWLQDSDAVEVKALKGTDNSLTITACKDTANLKAAVIFANGELDLSGSGKLSVLASGDGCKGINAKGNITIADVDLDIRTTGNNLGVDTTRMMGFGGPPPDFNFDDLPDSVKQQFEEMRKQFEEGGGMPGGPMGGPQGDMHHGPDDMHGGPQDMHFGPGGNRDDRMGPPDMGGFPGGPGMGPGGPYDDMQGGPGMGPGGKQKYLGTCKGIKSTGQVIVNSGNVSILTSSRGAEGIEGKKGVVVNGGTVYVDAIDDAINANAQIYFNGGKTTAISRGNDAVDANYGEMMGPPPFMDGGDDKHDMHEDMHNDPAIIIGGGEVYAYSQVGAPEEGLDCDFSPIAISAGKAFSIGAGMGDIPSTPTRESAKQPTALLVGLDLVKDKEVNIKNEAGKTIMSITAPFNFRYSSSIVTCPDFKVGKTYTVESGNYKKTFTMSENFTIVK